MSRYSIAIDGPAGAGKSTIAKTVARKLGFVYVDTGAMYRAFGLYCKMNDIAADNQSIIEKIIDQVHITIRYIDGEQQVLLNGENVNERIRTSEASSMASVVSAHKCVRYKLVDLQRLLAKEADVIMDGRDIGTFVLPDATMKIYLNASAQVRAKRRWLEMNTLGESIEIDVLKEDILKRDHQDMNREFAPLRKAEDAIEIDSSNMSIEQVVEKIIENFELRKNVYGNNSC